MNEEPTTAVIQRFLDALPDDANAEPVIQELLKRAVGRLRLLCAALLAPVGAAAGRPPPPHRSGRVHADAG